MRYNLTMTVRALLHPFLVRRDSPSAAGASDEDLASLEAALGVQLPETVRDLYRQANGLTLTSSLDLLPLARSLDLARAMATFEVPGPWGLVPLFDDGQSNPICVATRDPLVGFLVRVPHDDVKHLIHRGVVPLLRGLVAARNLGDSDEPPSPFADFHRTPADAEAAHVLLAQTDTLGEFSRRDALRFAFTLLDAQGVGAIAAYLDDADDGVRESARARLRDLAPHAEEAALAVQHADAERDVFARECVRILNAAGMTATFERKPWGPVVRVEPGPLGLNLDTFWTWRTQPDFPQRLTRRVLELQALRSKP